MRTLFPGNYRLDAATVKEVWKACTFVFDTNVILNLYRFAKPEREEVLSLLESIQDRIWIPHQVALEYQMNRIELIYERIQSYDRVAEVVKDSIAKISDALARERIDDSGIKKGLQALSNQNGRLTTLLEKQKLAEELELIKDEALRKRIEDLFTNRIGPAPGNQAWLDELYKKGKQRQPFKIPPAFMDEKKSGKAHAWRGMRFEREHGDLILWQQLIDHAVSANLKQVVLVTDDRKEDWWTRVKGQTIGPRPELVSELLASTPVEHFLMYDSVQFYEHAKKDIGASIKSASIEKIREAIAHKALDPHLAELGMTPQNVFPGTWELEFVLRGTTGRDRNVQVRNGNQYFSNGVHYFNLEDFSVDLENRRIFFTKRRVKREAPVAVNELNIIELGKVYEGIEDGETAVRYTRTDDKFTPLLPTPSLRTR